MKVISFFSRVAVVCNIAFILFAFVSTYQAGKPAVENNGVMVVSYFKNMIIVLGVSAIIINLLICLVYAGVIIAGKQRLLPKNLVLVNFLFFIFQIYYYFFRNHPA